MRAESVRPTSAASRKWARVRLVVGTAGRSRGSAVAVALLAMVALVVVVPAASPVTAVGSPYVRASIKVVATIPAATGTAQDISCVSDLICVVVGDAPIVTPPSKSALMVRTINGGDSWLPVALPVDTSELRTVDCTSTGTCVAMGIDRFALYSSDGGASWDKTADIFDFAMDVECPGGTTCYAAVESDLFNRMASIFKSVNGGATWVPAYTTESFRSIPHLACSDETHCVFGEFPPPSGVGVVRHTADGGSTWPDAGLPQFFEPFIDGCSGPICFVESLALVPTPAGTLTRSWRSLDAGVSWNEIVPTPTAGTWPIACAGATCVRAGNGPLVSFSDDLGATWSDSPLPNGYLQWRIDCPSPSVCFLAGGVDLQSNSPLVRIDLSKRSFAPLVPARLLETRSGLGMLTIDHAFQGIGVVPARSVVELPVAGRGGVALDAATASLNVTVTEPQGDGFVTVYPCGGAVPLASNLNYRTGQTVANAVTTRVGTGGKVCLYTQASTHLVVDVNGFIPESISSLVSVLPARLLETRPGSSTVDHVSEGGGLVPASTIVDVPVVGRGGVATDAATVSLNVTVTEPQGPGFITVFPCGAAVPLASNVNFQVGQTIANAVTARVGAGGKVCFFTNNATHLVVDVNAFVPDTVTSMASVLPARLLETRSGPNLLTVDGRFQGVGPVVGGGVVELPVAGRGGVDVDASTVSLNVTVTEPTTAGFVTVFPCGNFIPISSSVNYTAGATVANSVISGIGTDGKVCLYTSSSTHLVVDVNGYAL